MMWKLWTSQGTSVACTSNCSTVATDEGASSDDTDIAMNRCTKSTSASETVWVGPFLCLWLWQRCICSSICGISIDLLSWSHWAMTSCSWALWCISLLMIRNKSFDLLIIKHHLAQHLIIVRLLEQRAHQLLLGSILHEVRNGSSRHLLDGLLRLRCCPLIHGCD